MDFCSFAHIMKDALRLTDHNGKTLCAGEFTRELLSLCVYYDDVDNNPIFELEVTTFACYYSGQRSISKLAASIIDHIDTTEFCNKLENIVFDQMTLIINCFRPTHPEINDKNYVSICESTIRNIFYSSLNKKDSKVYFSAQASVPDMSIVDKRLSQEALAQLKLLYNENEVLFIHYACTNFEDPISTPRITCIAVTFLTCSDTFSFSYSQSTTEMSLATQYTTEPDSLEYDLLSKFYKFVEKHKKSIWVHWNMRNCQYGFLNIEDRYRSLGGKPISISNTVDLAHELKLIYGNDYVPHKRLTNVCKINNISMLNFIDGEDEATAAKEGNYRLILNSTLRKVNCLRTVFEKTVHCTLKTAKDIE